MSIYWAHVEDAKTYRLYRDGSQLVYSGSDTYAEDISVQAGTTYQLQVQFLDGTTTIKSEATTFVATSSVSVDEFECSGVKGVIRLTDYANAFSRLWRITPATPTGVILNVSGLIALLLCNSSGRFPSKQPRSAW